MDILSPVDKKPSTENTQIEPGSQPSQRVRVQEDLLTTPIQDHWGGDIVQQTLVTAVLESMKALEEEASYSGSHS